MKNLFFIVALTFFSFHLFAGDAKLFNYDDNLITSEFVKLSELEKLVEDNNITLSELLKNNSNLISNFSNSITSPFDNNNFFGEPPLGIPSFVWGMCLGVPGLAIVYFVTEDKEETKIALYGCLVGGVISIIFYFMYAALLFTY